MRERGRDRIGAEEDEGTLAVDHTDPATLDAGRARSAHVGSSDLGLVSVDPVHYAIHGEIARGGMGVVHRAHDRRAGREVALKELLVDSPTVRRRFEREARVTAQLQHPSIVPVYEVGCWPDGMPFYAMKLVGGRPLGVVAREARGVAERLALVPRLLPAVEAIAYAHAQGVIHRDLKPGNVLLGEFGETLVIDWGLAKKIGDEERSELTIPGAVLGTPTYMAPEQASGLSVDARADVFSLGALLYFTLSGQPPYEGADGPEVLSAVLSGPPRPLAERAPDLPGDLVGIVAKAMARDPRERYADAGALARDLEAFTTGRLVGAYHYTSWELVVRFVRRNRALSAAVVMLAIVAVAGALGILRSNRISELERERAVAAEQLAALQERRAHERLAQVQWAAAARRLREGHHLAAQVLAAAALLEQPANPASPYHALGDEDAAGEATLGELATEESELLAGPSATWAAARALRFAVWRRELAAHRDWVYDVLPSADGRWVVTTAADRRAIIWDAAQGTLHRSLEGHEGPVFQAALRGDGRELATSSYDGTLRVWSFPEGELLRTIEHPDDRVYGVCYASDGTLLAAGSGGAITSFDTDSGAALGEPMAVTSTVPWRLDCSRSEPIALMGTNGPDAVLVDVEARRVLHRVSRRGSVIRAVALSSDGTSFFVADRQGVLSRFDRASGELLAEVRLGSEVRALARSADGRWLALGAEDIAVVDAASLRPVSRLDAHSASVLTLAFDPDGDTLYSGGHDHRVIAWEIPREREGLVLAATSEADIDAIALSPDGTRLASAGDDMITRVWDLRSGRLLHALEGRDGPIRGVAFVGDDRLATSSVDRALLVYDIEAPASASVTTLPHFGDELALRPGTDTLAVGSGDGSVVLFDVSTGAQRALPELSDSRTWWVGFRPRGDLLAAASFDGGVALVDPESLTIVRRWRAHETRIYDADWRPDGLELTTADIAGWVHGWDPETGERLRAWRVLGGEQVVSLAWSRDARWLLVTTSLGVRLYHPDGVLEARVDLGARTSGAAWTEDGRIVFACRGTVYVLRLDTESWRGDPAALLRAAEREAGASLDALSELEGVAPPEEP